MSLAEVNHEETDAGPASNLQRHVPANRANRAIIDTASFLVLPPKAGKRHRNTINIPNDRTIESRGRAVSEGIACVGKCGVVAIATLLRRAAGHHLLLMLPDCR